MANMGWFSGLFEWARSTPDSVALRPLHDLIGETGNRSFVGQCAATEERFVPERIENGFHVLERDAHADGGLPPRTRILTGDDDGVSKSVPGWLCRDDWALRLG